MLAPGRARRGWQRIRDSSPGQGKQCNQALSELHLLRFCTEMKMKTKLLARDSSDLSTRSTAFVISLTGCQDGFVHSPATIVSSECNELVIDRGDSGVELYPWCCLDSVRHIYLCGPEIASLEKPVSIWIIARIGLGLATVCYISILSVV